MLEHLKICEVPGRVQRLGGHEVDDEDVDERENYLINALIYKDNRNITAMIIIINFFGSHHDHINNAHLKRQIGAGLGKIEGFH